MSTDNAHLTVHAPAVPGSASQDSGMNFGAKPLRSPQNSTTKGDTSRSLTPQRKRSNYAGGSTFSRRQSSNARGDSLAAFNKLRVQKTKRIYQNSYRMEPAVKFNPERARVIIEKVLHEKFDGHKYPPITHPEITKHLSAEIREKMKNLKVDRYKLVCVVTMGQKVDCSIMIASRCLSDASVDTFASYTYENMELFATAIVYAFYFE